LPRHRRGEDRRVDRQQEGPAGDVLGQDGGKLLTEMGDKELLEFVALDVRAATEGL
jgi:hypothetical protein